MNIIFKPYIIVVGLNINYILIVLFTRLSGQKNISSYLTNHYQTFGTQLTFRSDVD